MYRDENEALRLRVEQLEHDLAVARRENDPSIKEQAHRLVGHVNELQGQLGRVQAELKRLSLGKRPTPWWLGVLALAGPVVLLAGAGVGVLAATARAPAVKAAVDTPRFLVQPGAPSPFDPPPPRDRASDEPGAADRLTLTWRASVERASGVELEPGDRCAIEADGVRDRARQSFYAVGIRVVCQGATVWEPPTPDGSRFAIGRGTIRELPASSDGFSVYTLRKAATGNDRHGKRELELDSVAGKVVVWGGGGSPSRVVLTVDRESLPARSIATPDERIVRHGRVASIEGSAPVAAGATCTARATLTGQENDECAARVRCGDVDVLPDGAPVACVVTKGRLHSASSREGAKVEFRIARGVGELVLRGKGWSASVALQPDE